MLSYLATLSYHAIMLFFNVKSDTVSDRADGPLAGEQYKLLGQAVVILLVYMQRIPLNRS